ncbi:MAG: phage tail tape measure protein [Desulfobulbaceae bacterium]|nr:phage tail tape measure protein [Desulfobulbaceae bacterium]
MPDQNNPITYIFDVRDNASGSIRNLDRTTQGLERSFRNVVNAQGDYRDAAGRLRNANGRYIADTQRAAAVTNNLTGSTNRARASVFGLDESLVKLAKGFTALFVIKKVNDMLVGSLREFGNFEAQINKVAAVSGATAKELKLLSSQARLIGTETKLSAQEVAGLQFELAKLGFTVPQILEMTDAIGQMSVALGTDLSSSAEVAGKTLRQFNLEASETDRVVNLIAEVSANSAADMYSFAEAMKFAGTSAGGLGIDIEETTAAVGTLANVGLTGTLAGTGLSTVMLKLADNSSKAAKLLKGFNGEAGDLSGKMKFLQDQGLTVTEVFDTFGKIAGKSALALIDNANAMEDLEAEFRNGTRQIDNMTEAMSKGLNYQLDIMKSSFSELKITIGEALGPTAVKGIKLVTDALGILKKEVELITGKSFEKHIDKQAELSVAYNENAAAMFDARAKLIELNKAQERQDTYGGTTEVKALKKELTELVGTLEDLKVVEGEWTISGQNSEAIRKRLNVLTGKKIEKDKEAAKVANDLGEAELLQKKRMEKMEELAKQRASQKGGDGGDDRQKLLDSATKKGLDIEAKRKRAQIEFSLAMMKEETEAVVAEEERRVALRRDIAEQDQANFEQSSQDRRDIALYEEQEKWNNIYTITEAGLSSISMLTDAYYSNQISSVNAEANAEIAAIRNKGKRLSKEEKQIAAIRKEQAKEEYDIKKAQWFVDGFMIPANAAVTASKYLDNPIMQGVIWGGAATNGAVHLANEPKRPKLATGGVFGPRSGGVDVTMAENGFSEMALNAGPSGAPMLNTFADKVGDRISNVTNSNTNFGESSIVINVGSVGTQEQLEQTRDMVREGIRQGLYEEQDLILS